MRTLASDHAITMEVGKLIRAVRPQTMNVFLRAVRTRVSCQATPQLLSPHS